MMTELLFRDDAYLKTATARVLAAGERGIELDRTVFYPQGGGQAGDTGTLLRASGERLGVTDTRKGEAPDRVLHIVAPGSSLPQPGEAVALEIDWQRRYQLMRLHTALHLLSCVIVAPVTGGNIVANKARLDFDIELSLLNAARIETETNALIASGLATESVWITDAELDAQPELVKTMSVQPPPCAGPVRQLRMQQLEPRHVQILPQVDQHEIEWSRELPGRCERIADAKLDVFREPGARQLRARVLGLGGLQLERDHLAADRPRRLREPGGGVAVRAAHFKDAAGPPLPDHQTHHPAARPPHQQQ